MISIIFSARNTTQQRKQPGRFLECAEDKFLTQLVGEPARKGAPLGLLFANREGLAGGVVVGGHVGHSDHKMIEFSILREEWAQQNCYGGLPQGRLQPV